jgi:hypothetical protein
MTNVLLNDLLLELDAKIKLSASVSVTEIDEIISKISKFNDPASIGFLLSCLRDDALYDEAMFSLVHAAEFFSDELYVQSLLEILPQLVNSAPAWASVVLMRVFNSDLSRKCLTQKVRYASLETKNVLIWLISEINKTDPLFMSKTMAPLLAAKE